MSKKKTKPYTAEFKESAVKLAVESDKPVTETARELEVNVNTMAYLDYQVSPPKDSSKPQKNDEHTYDGLKSNCLDNAIAGSFFHTLKMELVHHEDFQAREKAQQAKFKYVEVFYNR